MNTEVTVAVLRLQDSLMNAHLQPWRAEQIEEALNALLANPHRTGEPFHLERNAMSDARKKLQRRAGLFADCSADIGALSGAKTSTETSHDDGYAVLRVEVVDTIRRQSSDSDRQLLGIALDGGTAGDIAEALGMDYEIAKVRLSRARQRARASWAGAN